MNDFERLRHYPGFVSMPHYSMSDRNMAMSMAHHTGRPEMRTCPVARQSRNLCGRELDFEPNGQPRRRIAVAVSCFLYCSFVIRDTVYSIHAMFQIHASTLSSKSVLTLSTSALAVERERYAAVVILETVVAAKTAGQLGQTSTSASSTGYML